MSKGARFAIVIPARYASSRYPAKPLVLLTGATGEKKTLIQRSYEAARAVPGCAAVVVATDDDRIACCARNFGAAVVMTPVECANGTERCAAALDAMPADIDMIVNLQGDAPLTPPWFVTDTVATLIAKPASGMATPAVRTSRPVYDRLCLDQAAGRVGGTTVAVARDGKALYFSKSIIPHIPAAWPATEPLPVYLHVGLYAYRRATLLAYAAHPMSLLEQIEGLEQLRFLDARMPVEIVETDPRGRELWELNNPSDVAPIEEQLRLSGIV